MKQALWEQLLDVLNRSERLVVHLAAENAPFSKKGGLGDVVESLPAALQQNGIDNVVITPYYSKMGGGMEPVQVYEDQVSYHGVDYTYRVYAVLRNGVYNLFLRLEEAFTFDKLYVDGLLPYHTEVDLSYFMLGKVMFHFLNKFVRSAVLFTHDWHVASIYPYLQGAEARFFSAHIIHNYHYQGEVFLDILHYVEEETRTCLRQVFDRYGCCSLSAVALEYADQVITVSPSYAEELKRQIAPHPFLQVAQGKEIVGLLNGMHNQWNPERDTFLVQTYSRDTIQQKQRNKKHLIEKLNLCIDEDTPILLVLSRLTVQKGIDLLIDMKIGPAFDIHERLEQLTTELGMALIVCGTPQGGNGGAVDHQFQQLVEHNNGRYAYINSYTEEIAHQLLAGADLLLHPSRFEPCGLTQMHALAYGTLPIVNPVGGLRDTVTCALSDPEQGFGFHMQRYSFSELQRVVAAVAGCYRDQALWQEWMVRGMEQRNDWSTRITPYLALLDRAFTSGKSLSVKVNRDFK